MLEARQTASLCFVLLSSFPVLAAGAAAERSRDSFGSRGSRCPGGDPYVDEQVAPLCAGHFPEKSSSGYGRWVVHFYGQKCRRCREAALALRTVLSSKQSQSFTGKLRFGAVDCHEASNERLCKEHGAWKLPLLLALRNGARYSGALDAAAIGEWVWDVAATSNLPADTKEWLLCPAFELYDEPRLAREWLTAHNIYRCTAGLKMLTWDSKLFLTAKRWADRAPEKLQHSPEDQRQSPSGAIYGENVAIGTSLWAGQVVARWHDEIRSTQGGRYRAHKTGLGHYTQLVWRRTQRVGC
ncbi:unnamed protein product, partial [Polarella glacialis]